MYLPCFLFLCLFTCSFSLEAKQSVSDESISLPDPLQAGWQGESVCENIFEDNEQRILRCTFPPGIGHEKHYHPPHFGYALSGGRMRIIDASGTREVDLKTGSYFSSKGVEWHIGENIGETTVQYLIFEAKD